MLARAFADDPIYRWLLPDARAWPGRVERLFAALAEEFEATGAVLTVRLRGAALWLPPDPRPRPWLDALLGSLEIGWLFGRHAGRAAALGRALASARPAERHGYLAVLGTDPAHRGEGVASRLLGRVTARCDAAAVPVYLETAHPRNPAFYARHGFAVRETLALPGGAPPVWTLWRPARARSQAPPAAEARTSAAT